MKAASNVDGICIIGVAACLRTSAMSVFAWQNSSVIVETSKNTVVLQDLEGKALGNVDVLIRDATSGSDCRCGKFDTVNK